MSPPSLPKAGTGEWKGRSCTNYTFKTIKMHTYRPVACVCVCEDVLTKEYLQVQESKSKTTTFNFGPLLTKYFKKCFSMVPTQIS